MNDARGLLYKFDKVLKGEWSNEERGRLAIMNVEKV